MHSIFILILALLLTGPLIGPPTAPPTAPWTAGQSTGLKPLELSYRLSFPQPHTHLYEVTFTIGNVTMPRIDLQMPVWTPGSYLVREFGRNLQDFEARDANGDRLNWQKTDKSTWRVEAGASSNRPRTISVSYRVYANELTVRTSHLDSSHAYFNGASVFMYVKGATDLPLKLKIDAPEGWRVTTPLGLAPGADGFYSSPNYDILVDSPTEAGKHQLLEFTARGKTHRIAVWGEGEYEPARLKEEFAKIVEEGALIFGGLPYDHYTFIIHIQPEIGGGLEHLNSTTCQTTPRAFMTRRGYRNFLGLISHEYFHLWNVKRIRPFALGPFDYQRENYTRALWVSEGITDYYGEQLLRRAGLISTHEYLEGIANNILSYESTPGRLEQTAESASFDSWIKFYRPDENSINSAMSYYLRGDLLGWLLDFEIRTRTGGARSLDDAMRLLLENYGLPKPGFTDAGLKAAFEKVAGGDLTDFFKRYVSGNEEIDFDAYLQRAGLRLSRSYRPDTFGADRKSGSPGTLGLRTRISGDRVFAASVTAGLPAYEGGINAGDELVALDGQRIGAGNVNERINVLDELRAGQNVTLTVFRRERLMNLELTAAVKPFDLYRIAEVKDATPQQLALRQAWLREESKKE
jgi:predicted metalloprotease with PDZ domain